MGDSQLDEWRFVYQSREGSQQELSSLTGATGEPQPSRGESSTQSGVFEDVFNSIFLPKDPQEDTNSKFFFGESAPADSQVAPLVGRDFEPLPPSGEVSGPASRAASMCADERPASPSSSPPPDMHGCFTLNATLNPSIAGRLQDNWEKLKQLVSDRDLRQSGALNIEKFREALTAIGLTKLQINVVAAEADPAGDNMIDYKAFFKAFTSAMTSVELPATVSAMVGTGEADPGTPPSPSVAPPRSRLVPMPPSMQPSAPKHPSGQQLAVPKFSTRSPSLSPVRLRGRRFKVTDSDGKEGGGPDHELAAAAAGLAPVRIPRAQSGRHLAAPTSPTQVPRVVARSSESFTGKFPGRQNDGSQSARGAEPDDFPSGSATSAAADEKLRKARKTKPLSTSTSEKSLFDKQIVPDQVAEQLRRHQDIVTQVLNTLDADGSGRVLASAARRALKAMQLMSERHVDAVIKHADRQDTGMCSIVDILDPRAQGPKAVMHARVKPTSNMDVPPIVLPRSPKERAPVRDKGEKTIKRADSALELVKGALSQFPSLEGAFGALDLDGDGKLTPEEFQSGLANLGIKLPAGKAEALLEDADLDTDGSVDFEEFRFHFALRTRGSSHAKAKLTEEKFAALQEVGDVLRREYASMFMALKDMDSDGDGRLSQRELKHGLAKLGVRSSTKMSELIITELDTQNQGFVTHKQLLNLFKRPS
mmetsp:Transcript_3832/g.9039  ORF Transcript_3832/g.9039 Transcript_3832/m.9039 type:complete len:705 (-) Transcript_3832:45-2159(-)